MEFSGQHLFFAIRKMNMQQIIEKAWDDRQLLRSPETQEAIREVIEELDKGRRRVRLREGGL
ncbi:MAG: hypothetical protein ACKO7B_15860, partial [Flavobacteriales bacterium]